MHYNCSERNQCGHCVDGNDVIIRRMNNSLGNLVNNSRDAYHISNVGGEDTKYCCHGAINESLVANGKKQIH